MQTEETQQPQTSDKSSASKSVKKSVKKKKTNTKKSLTVTKKSDSSPKRGPGGKIRNYPLVSFEGCFNFAKEIYEFGSGQKVRRIGIFNKLGKSPDSSTSRMMVTNCGRYGLTSGGYIAEFLELTTDGLKTVNEELSAYDRHWFKLQLAVSNIPVFKFLYDRLTGSKVPNQAVIADILKEEYKDIEAEDILSIVDIFIVNLQYLKLVKLISGAERIISFEYCLEDFSKTNSDLSYRPDRIDVQNSVSRQTDSKSEISFVETCFYITPIGEENSDERKHSDLFLGSIVEPALESLKLKVIRADKIDKPGTITKHIIELLYKAKLVIADLSFNNPNVFYELAIRHAFRLPTVLLIRKGDKIPFDISNSRTIVIDTTDIYALVPKIDTYRAEIAAQVRQALSDPDAVDNPLTNVYPNIKLTI